MRARTRTFQIRSLFVVAAILWGTQAFALHEESPAVTRVSGGDNHFMSPGRTWGNWLTFSSTQDLKLLGAERLPGKQIYVWNEGYFDCFNGTTKTCAPNQLPGTCQNTPCPPADIQAKYFRQLTNGVGDPDNPSLSLPPQMKTCDGTTTGIICSDGNASTVCPGPVTERKCTEVPAWFLEDRQWVAFDALGAFNGNIGAMATYRQIFLKNIGTGEIRQVTFGTDGDSVRPSIAERGGIVVFQSTAILDGFPNPTGVSQVYIYQKNNGIIRRISKGFPPINTIAVGPSRNPHPTPSGLGVVFESTSDLLGDGHDTGLTQIFFAKYDKDNSRVIAMLQVTKGNAASINPFIGDAQTPPGQVYEAKKIVFESDATDLPGTAQIAGHSIYEIGIDVSNAVLDADIAQVTVPDIFGSCTNPTIDASGKRIPMICTGDPLLNGTTGNRLFVLDRQQNVLYQITGTGDVQSAPQSNLGQWFVAFATTADLTGAGVCGYQIYIIDYTAGKWAAATQLHVLPPDAAGTNPRSTIGLRTFEFKTASLSPPSDITAFTSDGSAMGAIIDDGRIALNIGAPDEFTGEAPIAVAQSRVKFPPTYVPGVGYVCVEASGDGQGTIDCTGGDAGGDLSLAQDHNIDDTDFLCDSGCREDVSCDGMLVGPHLSVCPRCDRGTATCNSGAATGQVCDPDSTCPNDGICNDGGCPIICGGGGCAGGEACVDPDLVCQVGLQCTNDKEPTCNGLPVTAAVGTYVVGGTRISIPVKVSVSLDPGPDDVFCSGDAGELYSNLRDLPGVLRLTTGTSTGTITDVNNQPGLTVTNTAMGAPITCDAIRTGDLAGLGFVGHLSVLDSTVLVGLRDLLLRFHLQAKPGILGSCSPPCGADADCDDLNVCNGAETCIGGRCAVGTPLVCNDNDFCNGLETCDPTLGCQVGTAPVCDDNNVCTADSCDPVAGCVYAAVAGTCDDGDLCTTGDTCAAGACVGTSMVCTDNDACNGLETCDPTTGTCLPGLPLTCDDGNLCTDDSCDATLGCVFTNNTSPCDDSDACTDTDVCGGGTCAGTLTAAAQTCNAGNGTVCDGLEACDPVTGACLPGTPLNCDDTNPCTDDSCDSAAGCFNVPNDANPCSDGTVCTSGDACIAGACVGTPVVCDDGDACNGSEFCDSVLGCQAGVALTCDDANPCTDDSCDPLLGCVNVPNVAPCSDGNECTSGDTCLAGLCAGLPVVCDDADACNGVETCDPSLGCQAGTPPVCDDNNACTDDTCSPSLGCVFTPNDANPCDDGNACTSGDSCVAGVCTATPVVCSNNDACDGLETCNAGTGLCDPGTPPDCNDNNPCTDDSCDALLGCLNAPNTNACDDGSACTSSDVCTSGACVGTAVQCDDGNACNGVETCDPLLGCQIGVSPVCDDGDACTADSCDPIAGCVNSPFPNAGICRLIAVIDLVNATDSSLLGGDGVKKRLLRKLNGALRAVQKFYTGNPRRQRNNQRLALRRIEAAHQLVENGLIKGTFDPAFGDQLLDLLASAANDIQQAIP